MIRVATSAASNSLCVVIDISVFEMLYCDIPLWVGLMHTFVDIDVP